MILEERFHKVVDNFKNVEPILVIGDVGVDKYTYGDVKRVSPEAPVPLLEVTKEWQKLGLAANVSDNLQHLGVKSTLCGVIGEDNNANVFESLLEESGLNTWGILRCDNRMTTFKERVVTEVQQICRVDYETKEPICEATFTRFQERLNQFENNHSAVILEDYGKGLLTKNLCFNIIQDVKASGKLLAVDPARTTPPLWYKGAGLLKPNQLESRLMAQSLGYSANESIDKIAEILIDKLDLEKIIITLGAEGMAMVDTKADGRFHTIPTVANEVFDVSGAGDTAISTIIASLVSGATLEEAAWIGNCASGVVVSKKGTALVSIEELKNYYVKLKNSNIN